MRKILPIVVGVCLSGCATHIKYTSYKDGDDLPANGMKFALQSGIVTLAAAAPAKAASAATTGNASDQATDNCKSAKPDGSDWWVCFTSGVKPQVGYAPSEDVHVASPADPWPHFTTTKISGQPLGDSDVAWKQVTVSYTNNTPTMITSAGADAVAGFGVAGPWGALVGGLAGVATARQPEGEVKYVMRNLVCSDVSSTVDIPDPSSFVMPAPTLALPVVLDLGKAMASDRLPSQAIPGARVLKPVESCWRPIPNNLDLGSPDLSQWTSLQSPKWPSKGDGWFFRVVPAGANPPKPVLAAPLGSTTVTNFFASAESRDTFPYSACQKVDLQITWLSELVKALKAPDYKVPFLTYKSLKIADPEFVGQAKVPDGGVITFHSDCGANVVVNASAGFSSSVSATLTEAQALLKAQQGAATTTKGKSP